MKAIVIKLNPLKDSKHGGKYLRVFMKDISEVNCTHKEYVFDCYLKHHKSRQFFPYLKEQAMFDNLTLKDYNGRRVIDGNSDFKFLGLRHN